MAGLLFIVGGLGVALLWLFQFVQLMALGDRDFPGSYDKILWVVIFVVFFPIIGPVAFLWWKSATVAARRAST